MLSLNEILNLIPTHNRLRDPKSVLFFKNYLEQGQIFRCQKKPITLVRFEDDNLFIRDGHRRLSATVLAEADLLDVEYKIETSTYERYNSSHYETGWFTPFDVRTHCRLPDFFAYKDEALALYEEVLKKAKSIEELDTFVKENFNSYCEPRKIKTLQTLVKKTKF